MKPIRYFYIILILFFFSCNKLDLNPLAQGSSENWYSSETEIQLAVNDLFKVAFWPKDEDLWTDDLNFRGETNAMTAGTLNAETATIETIWADSYKAISRSIKIIESLDKVKSGIPEVIRKKFEANARFVRASQYARLISHWGDVPFYENSIDLDQAFSMSRTDKSTILQAIYNDYDFAAAELPKTYGANEYQYATKGAALAMKARIALYMKDYAVARDAAKACMDLNVYQLNPDYRKQFLSSTKKSIESIFVLPESVELGTYEADCKYYISRLAGGFGSRNPTFELLTSFLCTDGLPVDQSPLFDPHDPFKNRDPRCTEVLVEHQTPWLGFIWQPHPDTLKVLSLKTGALVKNNDTRANNVNAPFDGLLMKKGIDEDYSDDYKAAPDIIIIRYADVLLIYAEAKIELNEVDQSVLDAINKVRARAYKVDYTQTNAYPSVTTTDQTELRKTIRVERRMEFPFEGLRYMDLIRWKLAEKSLNQPVYGMLDVADLRSKVVNQGLWFLPGTPTVDDDALPDFSAIYDAGLIKLFSKMVFDPNKHYLWPIPSKEIIINKNLVQNPNY